MRKILLLLILVSTFALSAIDECKTDVYFGNGILTKEGDAEDNAKLLENAIKHKFYNGKTSEMEQHIGKVSYAYNNTFGFSQDIIESAYQILNITEFIEWRDKLLGRYKESAHHADLTAQVDKKFFGAKP